VADRDTLVYAALERFEINALQTPKRARICSVRPSPAAESTAGRNPDAILTGRDDFAGGASGSTDVPGTGVVIG
jgi:hypothetical protein